MKKTITNAIIFLLILICIGCSVYIISYEYNRHKEGKRLKELKQKITETESDVIVIEDVEKEEQPSIEENEKEEKVIQEKYKKLYSENNDFAGWLSIEGTVIDYPVLKSSKEEPTFYEHKDWNKKYSYAGIPFIDSYCDEESANLIIYGHNMKNGTMFGSLKKYKEENYYKEHPIINYNTLYEDGKYEIIGVLLTKVYYTEEPPKGEIVFYNYTDLETEEKFNEYVNYVKTNSLFDTGNSAEYGDKLITLCTCHYHTNNGRLIVVAKKTTDLG